MADFSTENTQKQMWALVASDGNGVFYFVTFSATSNRAWQGFQPCLARPQVEHA